jgi:hypothetical protein
MQCRFSLYYHTYQLTSLLIDLWDQICTVGNRSSSSSINSANSSASLDTQLQQLQLRRLHSGKSVVTNANSDSPAVPTVVSTVVATVNGEAHSSESSDSTGAAMHDSAAAAAAGTTAGAATVAVTTTAGTAAAATTAAAGAAADITAAGTPAVKRSSATASSLNSSAFNGSRGGESVVWEDFTAFWVEAGMVCIYPYTIGSIPYIPQLLYICMLVAYICIHNVSTYIPRRMYTRVLQYQCKHALYNNRMHACHCAIHVVQAHVGLTCEYALAHCTTDAVLTAVTVLQTLGEHTLRSSEVLGR